MPDASLITMDIELLGRCYWVWKMGGHSAPPNPMDILALPVDYLDQLALYHQGVMFYHDYPDRPRGMR